MTARRTNLEAARVARVCGCQHAPRGASIARRLAAVVTFAAWVAGLAVLAGCGARPGVEGSAGVSSGSGRPELQLGRSAEYDYDPPEPGTYELPALMPAADGSVLDRQGKPHSLKDILSGRISVLSFIYTRCADPTACPYATGVLSQIHAISRKSPELTENLQLITFSFDPDYDSPETMERFGRSLGSWEGGAPWLFLTTKDKKDLAPILEAYGQYVDLKKNSNDPLGPLNHNLRVYLVDRNGQVRNIYSTGMLDPRLVVTDVRTLLIEGRS